MNRAAKACGLGVALAATLAAGAAGAGPIKISEVLYDASGSDDAKVFVELFGPAGLGLDGYTLEGVNGADGAVGPVLALVGFIPADGIYVVADRDTSGLTFVPYTDLLLNFDLQNGPDSLVLRDPAGNVVDALGYGAFGMGAGAYAGEGMPAPDPPAGHSLARRFANLDTDDSTGALSLSLNTGKSSKTVYSRNRRPLGQRVSIRKFK